MESFAKTILLKSPQWMFTPRIAFRIEFRTSKAEIIKICDIVKDEMYPEPC